MERPPTEGKKVFANDVADRGLISNVYKQLTQLDIKKTTDLKIGRRTE